MRVPGATALTHSVHAPVHVSHASSGSASLGCVASKPGVRHAEAFASHHASQCGYCTPGFVVATHAALERCRARGQAPTPALLMQGLDGNLCRCTGYRPILDACKVRPVASPPGATMHVRWAMQHFAPDVLHTPCTM